MKKALAGLALATTLGVGGPATASSVLTFTLHEGGSTAAITKVEGSFCSIFSTCFDVETAGFDGMTFALGEGGSQTFDFLNFNYRGDPRGTYRISASLALSQPLSTVVSDTAGVEITTVSGQLSQGRLRWDRTVPTVVNMADGSAFSVIFNDFDYGQGSWLQGPLVATATIEALDVAPVPLPATGLLLLAGMGAMVALRRRRDAA
jgi:hypothetical protein